LIVGVTATACGSSDAASSSPAAAAPEAPSAAPATAADDLWIDEIDVYQGVKVTVVKDGALRARLNAPIIAGRPALVRVAVKPYAWTGPYIHGELRVKRSGKEDLVLTDGGKRAIPELDDELLDETLNFSIAAEDMTPDATFSFKASLADVALDGTDVVAFPADGGAAPFNAKTASQTLKVKFVPVAYEADAGVSLTPDLADLSSLKDTLYKMYPVANVDVTVREPLKWSTPVEADGPGWDTLLTGIMQLRRADKAEDDVYYVGVFTPKADLGQFCSKGGCILGVAPQTDERDINLRVALVLGYKSRGAGSTLAQELAHAMGRKHAPCGSPQAIDAKFPYADGGIGVWGYDVLKKALINPGDRYRDFMSYCGPTWVSDYTFKGLYERMEIVSQQQQALPGTGAQATGAGAGAARTEVMQSFSVSTDGTIHEGPALDMIPGESSDDIAVSYEGANGRVFSTTRGRVRVISGTGTRLVIAPVAPIGATHARVGALGLTPLHARVLAH
jgi:hypothetical protein